MAFNMPAALAIRRCDPELRNFAKSGGRTGTGREQRTFSDAGFWTIALEIVANTRERVLAAREFVSRLRQGEEVVARVCDAYKVDTLADGKLAAAASVRATAVQVIGIDADLGPGTRFSINSRLHQVTQVTSHSEASVGQAADLFTGNVWDDGDTWQDEPQVSSTVKFLPPLRAAAASGAAVKFSDLSCTCVLQDVTDGDLSLELLRHGSASLTLVESI